MIGLIVFATIAALVIRKIVIEVKQDYSEQKRQSFLRGYYESAVDEMIDRENSRKR